jgi:hypothetical protein
MQLIDLEHFPNWIPPLLENALNQQSTIRERDPDGALYYGIPSR